MAEVNSINPYTEEVLWTHRILSSEDVREKVELAYETQKFWRGLDLEDRLSCLRKLGSVLSERQDLIAETITLEMGKTFLSAKAEVEKCAVTARYLADHFGAWNERRHIEMPQGKHFVSFEPLGVILGIMPWNFPIWQALRFLAPALSVGNSVLLKPASNVFKSSLLLEEALLEAGFPEGVYQHLSLSVDGVKEVISSDLVAGVSLTGSASAGKKVGELAGAKMKKMVFELGGSDPYIVMADADLSLAAEKLTESRLLNAGQSCICAKRFIVDETVKDKFMDLLLKEMKSKTYGNPFSPEVHFGPLARKDLREDLHQLVFKAQKSGGKILLGGEVPSQKGYFYPATVIDGVSIEAEIYREEFFGPVALVNSFETLDEAFDIANRTPYGLGSGIFSQDKERAAELGREKFHAGMCVINDYIRSDVRLPFGGVKDSGFGRELGALGVHEFANVKTVSVY